MTRTLISPLGAEHLAVHADNVTDVILLKALIERLVHFVLTGVELNAAGAVLQIAERDLAHAPLGHEPSGYFDRLALHGVEVVLDLLGGGVPVEFGLLEGVLPASCSSLSLSRRIFSSSESGTSWGCGCFLFSSAIFSRSFIVSSACLSG